MYTGPKLTKENLVFGYDTGYGLEQHSSTRHYKGEPATNLITSGIPGYFGSGGETLYKSNHYGLNSDSGVFQRNFVSNPNTGNNAGLYKNFNTAALNSSTEYIQVSFDFYMITPYVRSGQAGTGLNGYLRVQSTNGTFDNYGWDSRYSNGSGDDWNNNSAYIGQWQKVSLFVDVRDDTTPSAITAMYIYVDYAIQGEGIYTNFIITEHATLPTGPVLYTSGTRSDTASLIDLKKTTDINVSSISFTSTGQPSYDETDDHITGVLPMSGLGQPHTIEMIFSCNVNQGSIGSRKDPFSIGNSTTHQYSALDVNAGNMNWYFYSKDTTFTNSPLMVADQFYHIVLSYAGGYSNNTNKKVWINGVQQTLSTGVNETPLLPNNPSFSVGRDRGRNTAYWPGEVPVWKVYQKALTQDDAISNYKAYKNRFNL